MAGKSLQEEITSGFNQPSQLNSEIEMGFYQQRHCHLGLKWTEKKGGIGGKKAVGIVGTLGEGAECSYLVANMFYPSGKGENHPPKTIPRHQCFYLLPLQVNGASLWVYPGFHWWGHLLSFSGQCLRDHTAL